MSIKKFSLLALFLCGILFLQAQNSPWNNKKCAVVLTYDDALNIHLDKVIPLLDSLKLKGSFYLIGYAPGFRQRVNDWRKAATRGHELGNHTLFHPCSGGPGRSWVKPEYDLAKYTVLRVTDEMRMTNSLLQTLDGKTQRTFAYPCGETRIGDTFYLDKKDFIAARTTERKMEKINEIDLYKVACYTTNGNSGEEMIEWVKKAMETNTLLVFLFHGVGGEHSINVSLDAHRQLVKFLKQHEKEIWVPTFMEMAEYVKKYQDDHK